MIKRKALWEPARTAVVLAVILLVASVCLFSCVPAHDRQRNAGNDGSSGKAPRGEKPELKVFFIDVGQGDACFIVASGGGDGKEFTLLVDAGPAVAAGKVVELLKQSGVKRIDYVVFTHPHEDHIGGGKAVLDAFEAGEIYMPRTSHSTAMYEELLRTIRSKGLSINEARAGKVILDVMLDGTRVKVEFLGPARSYDNLNDCSAVISVTFGERVFLLMGDAEEEAERDMIKRGVIPHADVLKVGHHGGSTSTTEEFLEVSQPSIAVISVGQNPYGHPSPSVVKRLETAGAKVYTTLNGTVEVAVTGDQLSVLSR